MGGCDIYIRFKNLTWNPWTSFPVSRLVNVHTNDLDPDPGVMNAGLRVFPLPHKPTTQTGMRSPIFIFVSGACTRIASMVTTFTMTVSSEYRRDDEILPSKHFARTSVFPSDLASITPLVLTAAFLSSSATHSFKCFTVFVLVS